MSAGLRKRLVIGNWKMHGDRVQNQALIDGLRAGAGIVQEYCDIAVCAPFPYLAQLQSLLADSAITWGAQDVSPHLQGAYTGDVSAAMLADFACQWVLVGHSERRTLYAESDETVAKKAQMALEFNLTPVICVGETLAQQKAGETSAVIAQQLKPILAFEPALLQRVVIAYEPVWAIGTGHSASPEQAQAVHKFIRNTLSQKQAEQLRILYGGSVKPENAANLFAMPDIDGALVGGASLVAKDFLYIAAA